MLVGDYLRYDSLSGEAVVPPMWCLVTELTEDQGKCAVIVRGGSWYDKPAFTFMRTTPSDTKRTTVPSDQLPDEVVVELARKALLDK